MNTRLYLSILISCIYLYSQTANADQHTFTLRRDSSPSNLQEFYCTATKVGTSENVIRITNWAQMVKGFNKYGILIISAKELNRVYFQAYHDPNSNYQDEDGNIITASGNYTVKCENGKGSDRKLIVGAFG